MNRTPRRRYLFADESGNFDFSAKPDASRFFAVGTITLDGDAVRRDLDGRLRELKYTLEERSVPLSGSFHATSDTQTVRDAVYPVLVEAGVTVDVTALEKRKADPSIRETEPDFYGKAWSLHFNAVARKLADVDELVVVGASLGTRKRAALFRRALQDVVVARCPDHVRHRVLTWDCKADHCLQAADYMLWAVMRDLERGDDRSRRIIDRQVTSCFLPFAGGTTTHY